MGHGTDTYHVAPNKGCRVSSQSCPHPSQNVVAFRYALDTFETKLLTSDVAGMIFGWLCNNTYLSNTPHHNAREMSYSYWST